MPNCGSSSHCDGASLVVLLAAGVPIGVGIGLSSAVSMICMLPGNVAFAKTSRSSEYFAGSNSLFHLISILFFILAGKYYE